MNMTSFLLYCIIATFTPGPTNIVILSTVHHFGTKKAIQYTYGATFGFALLLFISAILNSVLITVLPRVMIIMQVIGSLYMLYLTYLICIKKSSESDSKHLATFWSGFIMQFLNPKVVLFTLTVIPTFIMPYYNSGTAMTLSIMVITIIGFAAFMTWLIFGAIFKTFLQKHQKIVNLVMGIGLIYAALMIWI
ncbi:MULTISPECIES: LysE family translocator [unclassified Paenibacillus]|uniref:LysE family translocator n=1 Tax=Paenibacillus provencensis TaxID=441151 RepID=A0ABW3PT67_9BACL|nr:MULTISPECIES: LysE family translocator [unclassified Paenibacillus]MCM3127068.1 LysE family translocator [Paenibacillus sp. MER 78]SFS56276.1 Threonine/homoserine/homoserine lactone efflux protein [Paenibacillus sp. 453mf]